MGIGMTKNNLLNPFTAKSFTKSKMPDWLGQSILDGALPWEYAPDYTIEKFIETYIVSDSEWVTLSLNLERDSSGILVMLWNYRSAYFVKPVSEGEKRTNLSSIPEYVILVARMEEITEVLVTNPIEDWITRHPMGSHELRDRDGKKVWVIEGQSGGDIRIVFSGRTKAMALDYDKQIIQI